MKPLRKYSIEELVALPEVQRIAEETVVTGRDGTAQTSRGMTVYGPPGTTIRVPIARTGYVTVHHPEDPVCFCDPEGVMWRPVRTQAGTWAKERWL